MSEAVCVFCRRPGHPLGHSVAICSFCASRAQIQTDGERLHTGLYVALDHPQGPRAYIGDNGMGDLRDTVAMYRGLLTDIASRQ